MHQTDPRNALHRPIRPRLTLIMVSVASAATSAQAGGSHLRTKGGNDTWRLGQPWEAWEPSRKPRQAARQLGQDHPRRWRIDRRREALLPDEHLVVFNLVVDVPTTRPH